LKDHKSHKLKFNPYLEKLYQSDKPLIIYKVDNGYDIYTDFSKKINLTKNNIHKYGRSVNCMELVRAVTNEELSPNYFINHLRTKINDFC